MHFTSIVLGRPEDKILRLQILGVDVSTADLKEAVRRSDELIRLGNGGYICVADVHSVVEALGDPQHRKALNGASLTVADGMPLVWMGRLRGSRSIGRVYGPDFLLAMCDASMERGWRHFFYGGRPGIADRLATQLVERFPGLQIAGTYTPPFRPLFPSRPGAHP